MFGRGNHDVTDWLGISSRWETHSVVDELLECRVELWRLVARLHSVMC